MIFKISPVCLLVVVCLIFTNTSWGQEPAKTIPDGTDGSVLVIRTEDSLAKKLPANEFDGSLSTFKIGLGYIHDAVTYIQSDVFKQQMDSAGLAFDPMFKVRDFRILGRGVLKTKRPI